MKFIKKEDYKDFSSLLEFSEINDRDFSYRIVSLSEDDLLWQKDGKDITSFERYDAMKVLTMYNYLKYRLYMLKHYDQHKEENGEECEVVSDIKKQFNFFDYILMDPEQKLINFITPTELFVHRKFTKKIYDKSHKTIFIGRLYSNKSIQNISREIRYYLFKGEYIDFDIQNCHPSILYTYSVKYKIKLRGALKQYVEEKEATMLVMQQEILEKTGKIIEVNKLKGIVIKLMNRIWEDTTRYSENSETLKSIGQDFTIVRDHLWKSFREGKLNEFESAVEASIIRPAKVNRYTTKDGKIDFKKKLLNEKVILQCFYCQTQESVYLIDAITFLRKKYDKILEKCSKKDFVDFYPNSDRNIYLSAKHTLLITPFFDGFYVSSPIKEFMEQLPEFMQEYNKENPYINFVQKEIKKEKPKIIPNIEEFEKFKIIMSWFQQDETRHSIHKLITETDIIFHSKKAFIEFQKNLDKIKEKGIKDEEYEKEYEKKCHNLADTLIHLVFRELLQYDIKNKADIENIIKNL